MLPDMELAVTKTVDGLARFIDFSDDEIDEIKHAVIEVCINAQEHSMSRDRRLFLYFKVTPDRLLIQVTDRGRGFKPEEVEIPSIEKKMFSNTKKRGWGLQLIRHFMDQIRIDSGEQGTTVTMIKFSGSGKESKNG